MTDLADFLLARIAEDEAAARNPYMRDDWTLGGWDNARVLAECEAKRRIVELCRDAFTDYGDASGGFGPQSLWQTLQFLALPYADHPDYREEWRP